MTTEYTLRVTIVCPADLIKDANQLSLALGENAADANTFQHAGWQDASGNLYAASSTAATNTFENKAASPLQAPSHAPDTDLAAAARAQALVYIYGVHGTEGAAPGRIWVRVEPASASGKAAVALADVQQLPMTV